MPPGNVSLVAALREQADILTAEKFVAELLRKYRTPEAAAGAIGVTLGDGDEPDRRDIEKESTYGSHRQ
jgi:hypothetical protein